MPVVFYRHWSLRWEIPQDVQLSEKAEAIGGRFPEDGWTMLCPGVFRRFAKWKITTVFQRTQW